MEAPAFAPSSLADALLENPPPLLEPTVSGREETRPIPSKAVANPDPALATIWAIRNASNPEEARSLRDDLLMSLLPLVRRFIRKLARNSRQWSDLENEAVLAVQKAILRFNPQSGAPFTAYAAVCIKGQILNFLSAEEGLGIAGKASRRLRRLRQAVAELGENACEVELAKAAGMGSRSVRRLRPFVGRLSLNAAPDSGGDLPLGECAKPDPVLTNPPADAAGQAQLAEDLAILGAILRDLPSRERFVLEHLYGVSGRPRRNPADIAKVLGVTRQRVGQIAADALRRLRTHGWGSA